LNSSSYLELKLLPETQVVTWNFRVVKDGHFEGTGLVDAGLKCEAHNEDISETKIKSLIHAHPIRSGRWVLSAGLPDGTFSNQKS
jgi:hypothetical protein